MSILPDNDLARRLASAGLEWHLRMSGKRNDLPDTARVTVRLGMSEHAVSVSHIFDHDVLRAHVSGPMACLSSHMGAIWREVVDSALSKEAVERLRGDVAAAVDDQDWKLVHRLSGELACLTEAAKVG